MERQRKRGHRLFAAAWERSVKRESGKQQAKRQQVVSQAKGRVLEIGVGVGANWPYLPDGIDYWGVEPDEYMVGRALRIAAESDRTVDLRVAPAENLPFPDESFDTVIVTLTLCSVTDLRQSLSEARRVLKPGGELRFWEHVRPTGRISGGLSDVIAPAWKRLGAGCQPNRNTVEAVAEAGFALASLKHSRIAMFPAVLGVAVKEGGQA